MAITEPKLPVEGQAASQKPSKIIVAVHGIGDQFQFATIQSVANRYCRVYSKPDTIREALPLGKFYDEEIGKPPETFLLQLPIDKKGTERVGFTEIYWANIPRIPQKEGYIIEESKKWGKTVIDRLQPACTNDPKGLTPADLEMAKGVLEEMLETITVLERLSLIAEKAGIFKFDLKDILVGYLGDVQLVADFKKYRDQIIHRFFGIMSHVARYNSEAEIYIVAHSEGSVVAFLSLLAAVCGKIPEVTNDEDSKNENPQNENPQNEKPPKPTVTCDWVKQVRGFMTIGSPIDKHFVLWPSLWTGYEKKPLEPNLPPFKIQWRNYYDYGDPIGFELDRAREWLCANDWDNVFDFKLSHNYGFGRYLFPGKAHNDYWNDDEVFAHFFDDVVKADPIKTDTDTGMCDKKEPETGFDKLKRLAGEIGEKFSSKKDQESGASKPGPPNKNLIKFFSNVLPYFLVILLIFLGTYFLYKAVNEYEQTDDRARDIFRSVGGITLLLVGLTVAARIPRLTRIWKWRFAAFVIFALSAVGYYFITLEKAHDRLGCFLASIFVDGDPNWRQNAAAVIVLASIIAVIVYFVGRKKPRAGLKILLWSGFVGVLLTVGIRVFWENAPKCQPKAETRASTEQSPAMAANQQTQPEDTQKEKADPSVWPMLLATAAFIYLWWLAALIFDLVIVWHYYIRRSVAMTRLRDYAGNVPASPKQEPEPAT